MSSTARVPGPPAEPQAEPPSQPTDGPDSRIIVVTGATLPVTVVGAVAARYLSAQVVPIAEFTAASAASQTSGQTPVIFAADDLSEAWQLATATPSSAAGEVRLAFRTASAAGLDAVAGYQLDSLQPGGDAVIVVLRPTDPGSSVAQSWLTQIAAALPRSEDPDAAAPRPEAGALRKGAPASAAKSGRSGARADLLRRHRGAVVAGAGTAVVLGIAAGLVFGSLWVGLVLAGFVLVGLAQLGLSLLSYRAAARARTQAETAARTAAETHQRLLDDMRQLKASSAETTLLMREHTRTATQPKA